MEFVEFLNGGAPGFFRHAKAPDQLNVGDKELIALAIKCLRGRAVTHQPTALWSLSIGRHDRLPQVPCANVSEYVLRLLIIELSGASPSNLTTLMVT
jgi:hypothetical protein